MKGPSLIILLLLLTIGFCACSSISELPARSYKLTVIIPPGYDEGLLPGSLFELPPTYFNIHKRELTILIRIHNDQELQNIRTSLTEAGVLVKSIAAVENCCPN